MDLIIFLKKFYILIIFILIILLLFSFIFKIDKYNSKVLIIKNKSANNSLNKSLILNTTVLGNLKKNEMYYCFKLDKNQNKIFESYLSKNYFYESFNLKIKNEKIFYKNVLYQSVNENDCNWIIENYNKIYDNFKLSFLEYFNNNNYNCTKMNFNESIFYINQNNLKICKDYLNNQDREVLNNEI